jgi:exopolyphosphatase/guanosine-5'-triphosphate,3'-diphosphate pyrophosphatase
MLVAMSNSPADAPLPSAHPDAAAPHSVAVIDIGASAVRLTVAELSPARPVRILEDVSRGVLLGKDTFTSGRLGAATVEAALKALEGFRRIMDGYAVVRTRAVATSAVREAQNRDTFVDRVRLRTGIEVEIIDGSEENRLTYMAVRQDLAGQPALDSQDALLVEVGGGSADLSFLRQGEPIHSGTYALGSIRMRQNLAGWHGAHEQRVRLLRRHVRGVIDDLRRELPLDDVRQVIFLGGDARFAARRLLGEADRSRVRVLPREAFVALCDEVAAQDADQLAERFRLSQTAAETLGPALLAYRELLLTTAATEVIVPEASLRAGLLLDLARREEGHGIEDFSRQVLASAVALGQKYRFDEPHARAVAHLATRLFDELHAEHGLGVRHRLLLEVAALLHDIGIYVNLRSHHKHAQYLLAASEIFGLSREDMALVSNVARYHRRALPQKSHLPYMALDREARLEVDKLASILRVANALDADHLQKVRDLRVAHEEGVLVLEVDGAGDLTIERLAALSRADFFAEVFGARVAFREAPVRGGA